MEKIIITIKKIANGYLYDDNIALIRSDSQPPTKPIFCKNAEDVIKCFTSELKNLN